ncbi:MAG: hypothetical protein ACLP9S_04780 [Syntrophales bacterium]
MLDEIKRMRSRKKYLAELKDRYAVIQEEDKEKMLRFANRITPPNWNVWCTPFSEFIPDRGILNIWMGVFPDSEDNLDRAGEAEILGVMYAGRIANTHIKIYPAKGDWPGTVVHELAHIAVDRRLSLINKPYKQEFGFATSRMFGEDIHGPRFDRALELLRLRMMDEYDYMYVLHYYWANPMKHIERR